MKFTARQLRTIIREAMDQSSPRWPEKHFAWRNVVFTSDGDVRYIIDVSEPETVQAAIDIGEPFPPGTNVLIVKGAYPNTEKVHLHDSELLDLIRSEGWHERPPPKGADPGGFWDGKGEWQEPDSEIDSSLPVIEGKMRITKRQLRSIIREAVSVGRPHKIDLDRILPAEKRKEMFQDAYAEGEKAEGKWYETAFSVSKTPDSDFDNPGWDVLGPYQILVAEYGDQKEAEAVRDALNAEYGKHLEAQDMGDFGSAVPDYTPADHAS